MQSGKEKQTSAQDGVPQATASDAPRKSKKSATARELDTTRANTAMWLIKVPNYIATAWKNGSVGDDLGTIRISSNADPKTKKIQVSFTLAKNLASTAVEGLELPSDHKVVTQDTMSQCLYLFSENSSGLLAAEGKVTQRADVQPKDSSLYMKLKRHQIESAEKTKFTPMALETTPASVYKPKASHKEYDDHKQKQKELGKRARDDRETVLDLLFTAFQQHQYYNFKDLVVKTKQPPTYLKEILREVAIYNTKQPHKNLWELKPEYRHYKTKTEDNT